jgi:hypothetical protein
MSHRGIQTQNLPQASVRVVAITSREQRNGKNHDQTADVGKKPSIEQSVSSTLTVANGTG